MRSATDMLAAQDPKQAYRNSNFEARLLAASPQDMVHLCLDDLLVNLVRFEQADLRDDRASRSAALTRCIAALTALEMGVDRSAPLGGALLQLYMAAKSTLLGMVVSADISSLRTIKSDFEDIRSSFRAAA